jgi:hypothetical protein
MRLIIFVLLLFVTPHLNARDINYAEFKACYFNNHGFLASLVNLHKVHLLNGEGIVWISEPSLFSSVYLDWTLQGFYVWRELSDCTLDLVGRSQVCKVKRGGSTYGQLPSGIAPVFVNQLISEGIDAALFEQFVSKLVRALIDANGGIVSVAGFGAFKMHPQTYKIVQRNISLDSPNFYNPQDTTEIFSGVCNVGVGTVHQNPLQNGYQLFFTPKIKVYEAVPAIVSIGLDSGQGYTGQTGAGLFDGANANEALTNRVFYWRNTASYVRINLPSGGYLWRSGTATAINNIGRLKIHQIQDDGSMIDLSEKHLNITPINHLTWERFSEWLEPGLYEISGGGLNYRVDSEWNISASPTDMNNKLLSNVAFQSVTNNITVDVTGSQIVQSQHCKVEITP